MDFLFSAPHMQLNLRVKFAYKASPSSSQGTLPLVTSELPDWLSWIWFQCPLLHRFQTVFLNPWFLMHDSTPDQNCFLSLIMDSLLRPFFFMMNHESFKPTKPVLTNLNLKKISSRLFSLHKSLSRNVKGTIAILKSILDYSRSTQKWISST